MTKDCKLCGVEFTSHSNFAKYCNGIHSKKCVVCDSDFSLDFSDTAKSTRALFLNRKTCSTECTNFVNYGVKCSIPQREDVKSKIRQSYIAHHGGVGFQVPKIREMSKNTKLEKYGDENYNNRSKAKATRLKRYGDENYNNRELAVQTNLEKYGDPYYSNHEKSKQTNLQRYGHENIFGSEIGKQKVEEGMLRNWGVDHPAKSEEINRKIKKTIQESYGCDHPAQIHINHFDELQTIEQWAKNFKKEKGRKPKYKDAYEYFIIGHATLYRRIKYTCIELFDFREIKLELLVHEKLNELGVAYQKNVYGLINGIKAHQKGSLEIDIYIPDLKLGIECNDLATHQPRGEDNPDDPRKGHAYHANKSELAQKAGITLLHVWEDEIEEFLEDLSEICS